MTTRTARVATALLAGAAALFALATPAAATSGTAAARLTVDTGPLVLTPTDRGYVGTLTATISNRGRADGVADLRITEPAGASFIGLDDGTPWFTEGLVENRRVIGSFGGRVAAGDSRALRLNFQVWTTARAYPMVAPGGSIAVVPGGGARVADRDAFPTVFRSTSGSVRAPRVYRQATATDLTVNGRDVTLTRQADGSLLGRMPVTVRYGNDAPSFRLAARAALPAGVEVWSTDPQDLPSFPDSFDVPGGRFMPGEERTFDVVLRAPAGTPAGVLGSGTFTVEARYVNEPVGDVDPADDTTTFSVGAAG
ncbi:MULTISPECIES: hypothetical protein [Micromonospora]|uniref:hypothetical protein n=1 Tax=Micromonospora TaxID=1873 RepID=UPI000DEA9CF2|nr:MULTISPECIES: hypothetical protein [unclassified Micromonospora]MBQ1064251.1 hypothetical protein [Micromonospora sp. C41]RBQ07171.1 hypothetical protein DQE82_19860 [Micromonospora sp. LHW51205]